MNSLCGSRNLFRAISQPVPAVLTKTLSSPLMHLSRCVQCLLPIAVILLFEVNAFFLKYVLWLPPLNPLNTYRLTLLFLLALPSVKEYYEFIELQGTNASIFNKLGPFAWLGTALAVAETLLCIKFGHGLFPKPFPREVLAVWGTAIAAFGSIFAVWCVRFYWLGQRDPTNRKHSSHFEEHERLVLEKGLSR